MGMPNLKRITIHSELELSVWLARNSDQEASVMLVTHTNTANRAFVSRTRIEEVLATHGWKAGSRYTLGSKLLGHVISNGTS